MHRSTAVLAWLRRRAENIVALLLGSMFASFILQVVARYVLNLPLGWTVEFVTIAWLWGILFGYAFVIRGDDIIRFDIVYDAVSPKARRAMDIVAGVTCAGIFAWSLPKAYDFVTFMGVERTAFMRIRFDLVFSIYLPFAGAVIVRSLLTAWHAARGSGRHAPAAQRTAATEHA